MGFLPILTSYPANNQVWPWLLHRSPAFWTQPTLFDPERFLRGEPSNPWAFLPFGAGTRACIGNKLAEWELRVGLLVLLSRFHFEPASPLEVEISVTLRSKGLTLTVIPRGASS